MHNMTVEVHHDICLAECQVRTSAFNALTGATQTSHQSLAAVAALQSKQPALRQRAWDARKSQVGQLTATGAQNSVLHLLQSPVHLAGVHCRARLLHSSIAARL